MASVPESDGYVAGVYQLETTDQVEAGVGGISNKQARDLASRTKYLKDQLDLNAWKTGDVKEIDCDNAYITANFDGTGLGLVGGERAGWAICNGQNGTRDRSGRVSLGYGGPYTTMGAQGGNKDAAVINHGHTSNADVKYKGADSSGGAVGIQGGTSFYIQAGQTTVNTTGVTGVDRNLQPYIVTLFIQKL